MEIPILFNYTASTQHVKLYGPRDCYQADFLKEIKEFVRIAGIHDLEKYLKLYVLAQMETNWQWLVKVE